MADEAVLRIVVQDTGGEDAAPPERASPRPIESPAFRENQPSYQQSPTPERGRTATPRHAEIPTQSPAFDPYSQAEKVREGEINRERVKAAYEDLYGSAEKTKGAFDVALEVAQKMRGTLGGTFGALVGSILDVISAIESAKPEPKSAARIEAERRNYIESLPQATLVSESIQSVQQAAEKPTESVATPAAKPSDAAPVSQSQAIINEANEALRAIGLTQKEADDLLKSVMTAANKTFESVQDVLQAAFERKPTSAAQESKPPEAPTQAVTPEGTREPIPSRYLMGTANVTPPSPAPTSAAPSATTPASGAIQAVISPPPPPPAPAAATVAAPTPAAASSAAASMGGALAAAAGPAAIAIASLEAVKQLKSGAMEATRSLGSLAEAAASPDANPAHMVSAIGESTKAISDKLFYVSPLMSIFAGVVGEATSSMGRFMDAVDKTAQRYGEYSPEIAQAQALAEVRQMMGDFRRAQEAGPELAKYLQMQVELQQKFEDIKIKILLKILPIVTGIGELMEKVIPSGDGISDAILALSGPLGTIAQLASIMVNLYADSNNPPPDDPTSLIFQNPNINVPGQGIQVPNP